jgi:membrane-associated phospholipid phosphatase
MFARMVSKKPSVSSRAPLGIGVALTFAAHSAFGQGLPAPAPKEAPPRYTTFVADPVADGAILSLSVGVTVLSEAILRTGEIVPQQPQPTSRLLAIDRGVVNANHDPNWAVVSDVAYGSSFAFAALDPVLTGVRYGAEAGIVDAFIYGETIAITWSVTNVTKFAFRRPRPSAYREQQRLNELAASGEDPPSITDTNSALSFFSGHASNTAAVAATATYLAFSRAPRTARPWITLAVGAAVTGIASFGRVRSGKHFPTDVIAGAMVGIGIGVLVPHVHRSEDAKQRPVWVGAIPVDDGAALGLSGFF